MAATQTTNDAVIVVPPKDEGKVKVVTTETGTAVFTTAPTRKVTFEVEDGGTVTSAGAPLTKAIFSFTGAGTVEITNDAIRDSKVLGGSSGDGVTLGSSASPTDTAAKNVKIKTGEGSDTVTVQAAKAKNIKVDLGADAEIDTINVDTDIKDIKNMTIKNFGKEDTFTFKGKTFTADDLQKDNPFAPNINFKFS